MRRYAAMLLLIVAGCSNRVTSGNQPPATFALPALVIGVHDYGRWKLYAPNEPAFKVYFPSKPLVEKPFQADSDMIHRVKVERQAEDGLGYLGYDWVGCHCEWIMRDKPFATKEEERAYLKGRQEGALRSSRGKIVEEKEFTINGYQGREFILEVPGIAYAAHDRVYVAGNLIVQLHVWGQHRQGLSSGDALMFLDSLNFDK